MAASLETQLSLETQVALLCGRPHPESTLTPPIHTMSTKQHFAAILDSLAALCVSEPQQAFAVSASIRITGVTLHVSQTGDMPLKAVRHLTEIRKLLVGLRSLVEPRNPNGPIWSWKDSEAPVPQLAIAIYRHSLPVFRHHMMEMGKTFIESYESTVKAGRFGDEYKGLFDILSALYDTLERVPDPDDTKLYQIAHVVAEAVYQEWKEHLEEKLKNSPLYKWDRLKTFPLRLFLENIVSCHVHLLTILDLAKYDRYAVFLQGTFDVLPVAPGYSDVRIAATASAIHQAIPSTCTGPSYVHDDEVHNHMINVIANRARAHGLLLAHDASQNNINLSVPATAIHCECVLVAYHHHNPNVDVSGYIGLSEPPCFACHAYLVAYNKIIPVEVPHRSRFYIKRSSRVVRFPWAAPILQPVADGDSLNQLVRESMIDMSLRPELCRYAEQVRDDISEWKHAAERRALLVDLPTDGTSLYDIHSLIASLNAYSEASEEERKRMDESCAV